MTELNSRQKDGGWHQGGSQILVDSRYSQPWLCTSGIAVWDRRLEKRAMLTAGHCGGWHLGQTVYNFEPYSYRGEIRRTSYSRDISLYSGYEDARPELGYSNHVFVGDYQGTKYIPVAGFKQPPTGVTGCTMGATSGQICNVKVVKTKAFYKDQGPFLKVKRPETGGVAGKGDSGAAFGTIVHDRRLGKVFVPWGLVSVGQEGADSTNCLGMATICYNIAYFAKIKSASYEMEFESLAN